MTSSARMVRRGLRGSMRAAASGSLARNSSNKAPAPSVFSRSSRRVRTSGSVPGKVMSSMAALAYKPEPPTRIGRMPRDCRSAMVSRASCWNRATLIVSSGSMMSMRWCGTAACSSAAGFGGADIHATVHLVGVRVHDFGPLPASARRRAMAMPNPVLPDAVGPTMETTRSRHIRPLSAARNRSGRRPRRGRQADYGGRRV